MRPRNTLRNRLLALALLASTAAVGLTVKPTWAEPLPPAATFMLAEDAAAFTGALDVTITVRADNTASKVETRRMKVIGVSAVQGAGQQNLSYIEGLQTLEIIEAYTEKADGTKIPVDPNTILKRDAATGLGAVYLRDLKVVTLIFPDVSPGDSIVYTTRLEHKGGIFAGHFFDQYLFQRGFPFADSTVRVIAPKDSGLKVAVLGDGLEHVTTSDEAETRHVITYRGRPTIVAEPGMTSPMDRDPRIFISTFKNYEDQGQAYWQMAAPLGQVTPEIAKLADDITLGIENRRAQAAAIAHWVKLNIRYVAVYLGSARVVPNSAASVLKNRYGDCKDHVTLMAAMLAAKGIESEHVLISAGSAYTLPEPATMAYLNHAMIYLPEFRLYDDPTSAFSSFGVLSPGTYDKPVLHVSAKGAYQARTPAMKAKDHVSTRRVRATIEADGTVSGETAQIMTGVFAAGGRSLAAQLQNDGFERSAEQRLRNVGTPGKGKFEIGSLTQLGDSYVIKGRFVLDQRLKVAPGTSQNIPNGLPIQVRPGDYLLGQRYENRTMPFACFAGRQIEDIELTFAEGLPLPLEYKPRKVETKSFIYTANYKLEDRTLKIRREFISRVPGQVCAPELEAEIAEPIQAVKGSLWSKMAFKAEPKKPEAVNVTPPAKDPAGPGNRAELTPAPQAAPRVN